MRKRNWLLIVALLLLVAAGGIGGSLYAQASRAVADFENSKPLPGAVLYDQEGQVVKRLGTGSVSVRLDQTPPELQKAVQTTLDSQAISQYLARQILEPQGLWNRLKLSIIPGVLQRRYSERERLEMFMNQAYFGEGAVGVEAASQTYFTKPVQEIDLAESALLAALIQEPEGASPFKQPDRAKELRNSVLTQMRQNGQIDKNQEQQAAQASLNVERREPGYAHHFSDYLGNLLAEQLGENRVLQGGLRITTTLNRDLQLLAEEILSASALDGALVALSPDGRILAMVGGKDYLKDSTNLAVTKAKQVGSTLRPLIYATGLKQDWAMNHLVEDIQREFDGFQVENAGDRYWGTVTMKHALAMDLHNAAVWTLNELGVEKFAEFSNSLGLGLKAAQESLALAVGELKDGLSLLQLTAAFLPGINAGKYLPVSGFEEVADSENRTVLKQQTRTPTQVLSAQEAYLLTDMLGAGTKYGSIRELDLGFPAALTASSSQDGKAQWAVGYTPQLLAGVMLLTSETDQEEETPPLLAGQLWLEFMEGAAAILEPKDPEKGEEKAQAEFEVPANVETGVVIDVFTGLLANDLCPQVEVDAFISGTKPTRLAPCAIPPEPEPEPVPAPAVPRAPRQEPPAVPEPEPEPGPILPEPEQPPEPAPEPEPGPILPEPEQPLEPEMPPPEEEGEGQQTLGPAP